MRGFRDDQRQHHDQPTRRTVDHAMRKYCARRTELAISEICTPLANTIW